VVTKAGLTVYWYNNMMFKMFPFSGREQRSVENSSRIASKERHIKGQNSGQQSRLCYGVDYMHSVHII